MTSRGDFTSDEAFNKYRRLQQESKQAIEVVKRLEAKAQDTDHPIEAKFCQSILKGDKK